MRKKGIVIIHFLFLFLILSNSVLAQQRPITKIVIFGNERVSNEIILHEIKSAMGEPLSEERVREDIKAIYRLGYFRDVQVDMSETDEGVALTFAVIEKPFVDDIVISGNIGLDRKDIEEVIEIKKDSVLDMDAVRSSVREIKKLYTSKRYYGSEVTDRVEIISGNRAVVYFDIVEGVKGYIQKIQFVGNKVFSARKLKSIMKTKEKGWLWWLTKSGILEMDILEVDRDRIRGLYRDHGYVTAELSEPEITLSNDKKSILITVRIVEGDQYRLGSLDITGDILTTKEDLVKGLKSRVGKIYRTSLVHADLLWLTDQFTDKGYAYVDVAPLTRLDREKRLVDLRLNIEKGIKAYINRIEIKGNTKTRDKVVRREMKVAEGNLYSSTLLRKSRQRIKKTGYFKEVDFAASPTERKELMDLDIRVEETEAGALKFGMGYSSVVGVMGSVSVSHKNLFGLGYKAYASVRLGERARDFSLGFTDPRILDTQVSAGFDVFSETSEYRTYDVRVTGGDFKVGRDITDNIRADLAYLYERVKIFNVDEEHASEYIKSQRGTTDTGKVILTVTRTTIDDPLNPTKGSEILVSGAIAGLGGENYFYRFRSEVDWFHPIIGDLVVHLTGGLGIVRGYNGKEVPLTEKLYVGGIKTLRGFEYGMAGPLDETNEPIGALNMAIFSTEFLYPLSKALGLKAAVFYDVGKGWGGGELGSDDNSFTPLRHSVGAGIRWYSPLGPIRIDWGYNLNPIDDRGEKGSAWDFSMGMMY